MEEATKGNEPVMMQEQLLGTGRNDLKKLAKKELSREGIIRELEKLDDEIMKLHISRYKCKRTAFIASPQSELLKLRRSFLYAKLCEFDK